MSEEKNRRIPKKYILLQLLREIARPDISGKTKLGNSNQDWRLSPILPVIGQAKL
ncbi:hypothetical protein [Anaplasma phagocytophilum]|uniref:Uncharacterized protein n=1 Tax=Anaplasma phagocytophilum str. ApWI1 TaxID=1359155 RepID=A0A0F3PXC1_ANAPH|nr:hypothetical protein [Anaplasma phagocytophilum]KJV82319.1 hypothetical protein APHHGE2_0045 [Anaplasma phagocytophilum str. HGE2]KJV85025.1 hypothetical protein APHWI1_0813 [Anaplasma phagocytophilum str. ApWI1]